MGGFGAILGGALQGVGDGILRRADTQKKQTLLDMERRYQEQRDTEQRTFEAGQTDKSIAAHSADLAASEAGQDRRSAAEIKGATERARISEGGAMARSAAEIAAKGPPVTADDKLLDRLERTYTSSVKETDPDTGEAVTVQKVDQAKVADALRRRGRDDLAKDYTSTPSLVESAARDTGGPLAGKFSNARPSAASAPRQSAAAAPAGAIPLPQNLSSEADETVVQDKSGKQYVKRGGYLIPK